MSTNKSSSDRNPKVRSFSENEKWWGNSESREKKQITKKDITPAKGDTFIYRAAVVTLGLVVIIAILATIFLPVYGHPVPEQLWMLAASVIAIFSILIKDKL